jgi:hypothetical protein
MTPPNNIARLQAWAKDRHEKAGLEELAFCPGADREINPEDAAYVALELIAGYEDGEDATEA